MGIYSGIQQTLEIRLGSRNMANLAAVFFVPLTIVRIWYKAKRLSRQIDAKSMSINQLRGQLEQLCPRPADEPVRSFVHSASLELSIIMPVYNADLYLEDAVLSVLQQETSRQFELICVNDGSTDQSAQILERLSADPRLVVIHQLNGGIARARNSGLDIARGHWIMFLDSDDILASDAAELLMHRAKLDDVDIVAGGIVAFQSPSAPDFGAPADGRFDMLSSVEAYSAIRDGFCFGKLYRRSLWQKLRFPAGYQFEDGIIKCLLFPLARRVAMTHVPIVGYRWHEKSITRILGRSTSAGIFVLWMVEKLAAEHSRLGLKQDSIFDQMIGQSLTVYLVMRTQGMPVSVLGEVFCFACSVAKQYRLSFFSSSYEEKAWRALTLGRFNRWYLYSSLSKLAR